MMDYTDRAVIVTGGTGALGSAVVTRLLALGAECWIPLYHEDELARFPHTDHERVHLGRGVDLRDDAAAEAFFSRPDGLWASIHITGGFAMAPIEDTSLDDWRRMMQMNATTCFLSCREAVRRMKHAGIGGRIVNIAARPALVPTGGMVAYAASKAAVASITQSLAEEVAASGIWVNAVTPSIMDTPANRRAMPDADHAAWPSVADAAETIVFLASPANRATRGGIVPVYGRS